MSEQETPKDIPTKKIEDVDATTSSLSGLAGLFETALRRFRTIIPATVLFLLYSIGCTCIGLSLIPSVYVFSFVLKATALWTPIFHYIALAMAIAVGYVLYGFTLVLLVLPLLNFILPTRIKPSRGSYYSLSTVSWYIHNGLTYIARFTFLWFITPSPFNVAFYKLMGMKIGKGVQINSTHISDPRLIHLEDKVTIGGSATLIGHYGQGGFLVFESVHIGRGATIGLKAIIMGNVKIGAGAKILANSLVMPKTRIPENEVWGGIPAKKIELEKKTN